MDWVKLDGKVFDVLVLSVERSFNILYSENTGRVLGIGAPIVLDPLGTFYGHKITFGCRKGHEKDFDNLWTLLSTPCDKGIMVDLVYNQGTLKYEAYVSNGTQGLNKIDDKNQKVYWGSLQANIIPVKAQVLPL